jgi:SAM-dependent methyltransferase
VKSLLLGLWRRLRGTPGSPVRAASAVAIGLFIGCQPLYGLHFALVLAVCLPLRLDSVLSYLAANISNPFVAPFLIFAEVEAGSFLLTGHWVAFDVDQARRTGAAGFAQQLLVGSLAVGAALALLGFLISYLLAARRHEGVSPRTSSLGADDSESARERTRARYAQAPRADRYYVAGKLAFDPVFSLLATQPGDFGRVLDLGCGRGQLSAFLLELGRASQVTGIDSDPRKVEVARRAVPEAELLVADAAAFELPVADTVLLVDLLHYLPREEQDALLSAGARALAPGGRLLVRELDGDPSARSQITRLLEWFARKLGVNRGRATHYRPARELTSLLEKAGLACSIQGASDGTPFSNVLIVAATELGYLNTSQRGPSKQPWVDSNIG